MSFLKLKNYTQKNSIPILFSKGLFYESYLEKDFLFYSSNFYIKSSLYTFLKLLQYYKKRSFLFGLADSHNYSQKLQSNGFFFSFIEIRKRENFQNLKGKMSTLNTVSNLSFQNYALHDLGVQRKTIKNLSKGYSKFEKYFVDSSKTLQNRQVFISLLKAKRFISKVLSSRLFLSVAKGRKRYRTSVFYFYQKKRKIDSLLNLFTSATLHFKEFKTFRRKVLNKLGWKVRKQKKWLRVGSWNLFRRRQRLSQIFYVPKQFEVNYKTFEASYLGFTDFKTTYTRIPFRLNLRKLLTFLS